MNNKQRHRISVMQLAQILMGVKGHPFTHWALFTEATLTGGKKTLAQFGGVVYKYATYTIAVNRDYNRAIELLAEKLGIDFENWTPAPHNYADNIGGNLLCHRADLDLPMEQQRLYAQFLLHKECQREFEYMDSEMRPIDFELIKPHLRDNTSKKQLDLGIAKEVQIPCINPSLNSIKAVSLNGEIYEVVAE